MRPAHSEVPPVAAEGDISHEVPRRQRRRTWRRLLHISSVSQNVLRQKVELAGARPTHARAPPGAPSPVKLRQTYSQDAFRRRTKSKYRESYKKCLRIGSYGAAISPHCVANLYKGGVAIK